MDELSIECPICEHSIPAISKKCPFCGTEFSMSGLDELEELAMNIGSMSESADGATAMEAESTPLPDPDELASDETGPKPPGGEIEGPSGDGEEEMTRRERKKALKVERKEKKAVRKREKRDLKVQRRLEKKTNGNSSSVEK